jgi:hypothetical protein
VFVQTFLVKRTKEDVGQGAEAITNLGQFWPKSDQFSDNLRKILR